MADFHFLRPLWFIALIALPLIIWLIKKLTFQYSGWQQVIPAHLQKVLMSQGNKKQSVSIFVPSLIFVLAVTALAGPTYQKLPQPVFNVERGSVIVMDMSYSMYSTDVAPNRLTRSRFKAIDILDSINEGDIGLVAYAGASFIISPLTQDINNIKLLLPSLTPEIMPEIGSDPFPALLTANDMLINAGHLKGDIYWLTDDVDRLDIEAINEFIQDYPHRLNILGIGTSDGAPITLPNGELLKDDTGQIVIPKLPIGKLNGLAKKSGGVYQTITHSHDDVESLTSYQLPQDSKELEQEQTKLGDSWQELGPYIVFAILPFVLGYFRRGIILSILPIVMFLSPTPSALAQSADKAQEVPTKAQPDSPLVQAWNNLWQTPDQQAQKKYNDQNFEAAAQQFEDKLWQSSAQYRSGNYQQAAEILSGIDTPQALYNKGNALAKAGQIDEAIEAYQQALDQQPDFTQAQDNKALLEKLKEQNQQQDQQGKDQDQQKESEQNENQNNDQQGEQNGANDQENQNSESQEQKSDTENQQDQSQNNKQENQNQQDNAEQDQEQSDQQQQNEQDKQQEQQAQNQNQQKSEGEEQQQEMKQAAMQESDQKQKELEQKHMQLLNKVTDDPHLLLRNKMQLEYQKRRHQNSGAKKKW